MSHISRAGILLTVLLTAATALSQDEPRIHTVRPGPFTIELALNGVFESPAAVEVSRTPEAWDQMIVVWAADAGATVKKSDPLVKLRSKDLDQRIEEVEAGLPLARIQLEQARQDLRLLEIVAPRDIDQASHDATKAEQVFGQYVRHDHAFAHYKVELDFEWTGIWQDWRLARLHELVELYTGDKDVTRVEAQVLRQQRLNTKRMRVDMKARDIGIAYRDAFEIPRELVQRERTVRDAQRALDRARTMIDLSLRRKRLEVAQMAYGQAKKEQTLRELKADRDALVVRAPADGTVYYGPCVNGRWPHAAAVEQKLRTGGRLAPNEVFMTIVPDTALQVRVDVAENQLHEVRQGTAASVVPTAWPQSVMAGEVSDVRVTPTATPPFSMTVALTGDAGPVRPGMTCQVRLVVYENADALTVPAAAITTDPDDAGRRYVYVRTDDEEPEERDVTVGRRKNGRVEITAGLAEGDVVLLERPGS